MTSFRVSRSILSGFQLPKGVAQRSRGGLGREEHLPHTSWNHQPPPHPTVQIPYFLATEREGNPPFYLQSPPNFLPQEDWEHSVPSRCIPTLTQRIWSRLLASVNTMALFNSTFLQVCLILPNIISWHQNPVHAGCAKLPPVPLPSIFPPKEVKRLDHHIPLTSYTPLISYEQMIGHNNACVSQGQVSLIRNGVAWVMIHWGISLEAWICKQHTKLISLTRNLTVPSWNICIWANFMASGFSQEQWVGTSLCLHDKKGLIPQG